MTKAFSHRENSRRLWQSGKFPVASSFTRSSLIKDDGIWKSFNTKMFKIAFLLVLRWFMNTKRLFLNFSSFVLDRSKGDGDTICKFNLPFKFNIKQWKTERANEIVYVMQIDGANTSPTHSRTPGGFVDQRLICFLINVLRFHFIASRPSRFIYGGLRELYYQSIFLINNFSCLHETPGNKKRT